MTPERSKGRWLSIRVRPAPDRRDAMSAALFELGSAGVVEEGDDLVTQFPPDTNAEHVRAVLSGADLNAPLTITEAENPDWTREWRGTVRAHRVGPLTIAPPWLAEDLDPATTIVIEPAMAFGTGEHETTRGVTHLLASQIRGGDVVADLGAGSAVLAIAAAKLGAARVAAIEMDPDAIGNAEENVARNGVSERVTVIEGDAGVLLALVAPVRVILANIISSVLIELLPAMAAALTADGVAILSGILVAERDRMLAAFAAHGWQINDEYAEGEWWSVVIARP